MLRVEVGEGCSPRPVFVQASRQQKSIPLLRRAGGLVTTASSSMTRAERGGRKAAFDRAKEALREGMDLISCRQKLIKFADRSKAGWAVVDEYVDDDIADDSEDEKHMERAEGMAERKLAKRCKATQETGGGGGGDEAEVSFRRELRDRRKSHHPGPHSFCLPRGLRFNLLASPESHLLVVHREGASSVADLVTSSWTVPGRRS